MFLGLLQDVQAAPEWFNLDLAGQPDVLGSLLVCFFTLAVFSFLYSDNPFYKFAEHVFVGLGTAYYTLQYYDEGILQPIYEYLGHPQDGVMVAMQAGLPVELGGFAIAAGWALTFRLAAAVLAVMLLMRLFAPNSWMPRWPLAIMVGVYAALKMTGETQSKLVLLVGNAMKPLTDADKLSWAELTAQPGWRIEGWEGWFVFCQTVFFVGLVCALLHFVFTYRRNVALAGASRIGVITLMITFGAMFGFTVLGRIALLIERIADLGTYTAPAYSLAPGSEDFLRVTLSPPILIAVGITAVLALGALRRRDAA